MFRYKLQSRIDQNYTDAFLADQLDIRQIRHGEGLSIVKQNWTVFDPQGAIYHSMSCAIPYRVVIAQTCAKSHWRRIIPTAAFVDPHRPIRLLFEHDLIIHMTG